MLHIVKPDNQMPKKHSFLAYPRQPSLTRGHTASSNVISTPQCLRSVTSNTSLSSPTCSQPSVGIILQATKESKTNFPAALMLSLSLRVEGSYQWNVTLTRCIGVSLAFLIQRAMYCSWLTFMSANACHLPLLLRAAASMSLRFGRMPGMKKDCVIVPYSYRASSSPLIVSDPASSFPE